MPYNPRVIFLLLQVQTGWDVWRREKRGGRLLGYQEAGEGEVFTLWRVGTTWVSLLCKAAEDSY